MGEFFSELYAFGWLVVVHWGAYVIGGSPWAADEALKRIFERYGQWSDRNRPLRRRVEIAALLVGLLFAGFQAWQDEYHTQLVTDRQRQGAIDWLSKWHARADERWHSIHDKGGLEDQIGSLQKQSSDAQKKPPRTIVQRVPIQVPSGVIVPQQTARLSITRLEFVPVDAKNANSDQGMRVYYRDSGTAPASAPVAAAQSRVTDAPLSDADIAAITKVTNAGTYSPVLFDKDRAQIETDKEYWKFAPGVTITIKQLQDIQASKKYFYLFFSLSYVDDSIAPKKYWLTEFASMQQGDTSQYTILRSRTNLRDAP